MNSHQMSYVSDKLAKFFYKAVSVPNHNFRQGILESIHDIFGYQRVTYWEMCIRDRFPEINWVWKVENV